MVKVVAEALNKAGVRAVHAISNPRRAVEKLVSGEADVAVGVASRYGALVRGIDLPEVIRYALFLGVPAIRLDLRTALLSPRRLLRALLFAEEKDKSFSDYRKRLEALLRSYAVDSRIIAAVIRGQLEAKGKARGAQEASPRGVREGCQPAGGPATVRGTDH